MDCAKEKISELKENHPITRRKVQCQSFKYYNKLIKEYCAEHNIDLNSFIPNCKKNFEENDEKRKEMKTENLCES